ncbi:MAG: hypothetical protein HRU19_29685 [Pseudobacteriovorax sp.]|nr:hypothetical protein [Pseudobacteriovorax sp.]
MLRNYYGYLAGSMIFFLWSCGQGSPEGKNSELLGLNNVELVEANEDGTFSVTCRDGTQEIVTQYQMSQGDVCVVEPEPPIEIPDPIELCGNYSEPVHLKEQAYLITCDVSFLNKTIISAGAKIEIDDSWDIQFKNDVFAYGEADKPIRFSMSENSRSISLRQLTFTGKTRLGYTKDKEYLSGTLLRYVELPPVEQRIYLSKIFVVDSKFGGQRQLELSESFLSKSSIIMGRPGQSTPTIRVKKQSYLLHNQILSAYPSTNIETTESLVAWNLFDKAPILDEGNVSVSFRHISYKNSVVVFNQSAYPYNESRYGRTLMLQNNFKSYNQTYSQPGIKPVVVINAERLSTNSFLVLPFPLFDAKTVALGEDFGHPILSLDKNGWRFDKELKTTLRYRVNGDLLAKGFPEFGYYPKFAVDKKESYFFEFTLQGVVEEVFFPEIRFNVYND